MCTGLIDRAGRFPPIRKHGAGLRESVSSMEGAGEFMEIERMKIEYGEARGDGMED